MLLIAILAVVASLTTAASPAFAQSPTASPAPAQSLTATVLPTVCQESVCLTVTVESPTEVYLMARARHAGSNCGRFAATLEAAGQVIHAGSNISCGSPPLWCSGRIEKPAGSGWVWVRFISNPPTAGEPVVFF